MSKLAPLLKLEAQRGADCALACLASLTGFKYEDILAEASRKKPPGSFPHETGLYMSEIARIALLFGCVLKHKRTFNLEKDEGILAVKWRTGKYKHHVVVAIKGIIIDLADMTVWTPADYKKFYRAKFCSMLVPI
jgi:hypothetical protein